MKTALTHVFALLCFVATFSTPAFADDAELKKQVDQINSAFMESFNKQDAAGIAALFSPGAIFVNQFGPQTDIAKYYEGSFKAGFNHAETKVDQVWPLGADIALGMGQIRITGKNQSGAPIEIPVFWTATYVKEADKWKIRMLTGVPKAPPPAK